MFLLECIVVSSVILITVVLLALDIPLKTAFVFCKSSFEPYVSSSSSSSSSFEYVEYKLEKKLGIWFVDKYICDHRGGIYFRIGSDVALIDTCSYGFAYKPNDQGTPFGNAGYTYSHVIGDWYLFSATDDY